MSKSYQEFSALFHLTSINDGIPLCRCLWTVTERLLTTGHDIFSESYDQALRLPNVYFSEVYWAYKFILYTVNILEEIGTTDAMY